MTTTVSLHNVYRTFADASSPSEPIRAVDGIDLEIHGGQIVALLGPNGAGKTTTLDLILGLTRPTTGQVRVFGGDARRAVLEGRLSAVLQSGGLLADLTVYETVRLIASTFGSEAMARVASVLERAGVEEIADRLVSKCSGGEQQRVRFALALLPEPDLLILDEPTAGMDINARRDFWATMRAEAAKGRTVIFATHYLEEADAFAQRIVLLSRGKVIADGPTQEIRQRASGRTVGADVPPELATAAIARLSADPSVISVDHTDRRLRIAATNADDVARLLLNDLGCSNLEITSGSLEDAFVALTHTQEMSQR